MPVIKSEDFGTERVPEWCRIAGGICGMGFWVQGPEGRAEPHFHDHEEFWFVLRGRARVRTEGEEREVAKGDVVCTGMGEEHAVLEILEAPYEHVWIACGLRGRRRGGHLHRGADEPA
jgi:mannose-6-phosphate isomerase-like protein (cupin superfamily)